MANVELKKDLLLLKEYKIEVMQRFKNGEKKYEDLWLESKARYESLPFVQNLLKAQDELKQHQKLMIELEIEEKKCFEDIKVKKESCNNLDRKRIIELANFMVNNLPKTIEILREKSAAITELTNELEKAKTNVEIEVKAQQETKDAVTADKTSIMPKLPLMCYADNDVLSTPIDEVKIQRVDLFNETPDKNIIIPNMSNIEKNMDITEAYISSYCKPSFFNEENKPQNSAKMKLIHILEDMEIDKKAAQKFIENVNPDTLQQVDFISVGDNNNKKITRVPKSKEKPTESEEIEEIDMTCSNSDLLLIPPTQFLDHTLGTQSSQKEQEKTSAPVTASEIETNLSDVLKEGINKKKVSFDLPDMLETNILTTEIPEGDNIDANETVNSQMNSSVVTDDGFDKIKDMIMRKHNLDMSPQFVYPKYTVTALKPEDTVVTSKFFQHDETISKAESEVEKLAITGADNVMEVDDDVIMQEKTSADDNKPNVEIDVEEDMFPKPKKQKINEQPDEVESEFKISNLAQMISEHLDVSMNNTGLEDSEANFPHCLDSSLLLSPKADVPPMPLTGENTEVLSLEVPNYLSGFRKTGFSFFGCMPTTDTKPESNAQNPEGMGFNFNFDGKEKKTRGSLFSMFK